ncbi:heterokaryon incompatibility protein-domain-containing protein, partial [Lasiosphaeria ovina]
MQSTTTGGAPAARILHQQVDFTPVRHWLDYCASHHGETCTAMHRAPVAGFRVIDCRTRDIVSGTLAGEQTYAALSYVWGSDSTSFLAVTTGDGRLPDDVPRVVKDAMEATLQLGFRFLWVDRYCIRQDRPLEKHEQIKKMGDIYEQAVVTIVAAAGDSGAHGLPGVRDTPRVLYQNITIGDQSLSVASTNVSTRIQQSRWNTRGWTYQESLLSRRRLVFTDSQVYFQCHSMSCFETLSIHLDDLHDQQSGRFRDTTLPRVFPTLSPSDPLAHISLWVSQFSRRSFSFESDALDAFQGILRVAEAKGWIRGNICGLPLPNRTRADSAALQNFLLWETSPYGKVSRRAEFPSWSWVGWR